MPDIYCVLVSMLMDYGPTKPNGQYRIHCFWGNIKFYLFSYSNQTWVGYQELVCLNLNCPVIYCSDCVYTTDSLCPECVVVFTRLVLCIGGGGGDLCIKHIQDMHWQMLWSSTRHKSPKDCEWCWAQPCFQNHEYTTSVCSCCRWTLTVSTRFVSLKVCLLCIERTRRCSHVSQALGAGQQSLSVSHAAWL